MQKRCTGYTAQQKYKTTGKHLDSAQLQKSDLRAYSKCDHKQKNTTHLLSAQNLNKMKKSFIQTQTTPEIKSTVSSPKPIRSNKIQSKHSISNSFQ